MMLSFSLLLFVFVCRSMVIVESFPTGSGSCIGNEPAVSGSHIESDSKNVTNGTLIDYNYILYLNGYELQPGYDYMTYFEINETYTLEIMSNTANMTGCFIRLEIEESGNNNTSPKDIMVVESLNNTIISSMCDDYNDAYGLTHFNNDEKTICSGSFIVNTPSIINIDITIVIENDDDESIYAYNRYITTSSLSLPPQETISPSDITSDLLTIDINSDSPATNTTPSVPSPSIASLIASDVPSDMSSDIMTSIPTSAPTPTLGADSSTTARSNSNILVTTDNNLWKMISSCTAIIIAMTIMIV